MKNKEPEKSSKAAIETSLWTSSDVFKVHPNMAHTGLWRRGKIWSSELGNGVMAG